MKPTILAFLVIILCWVAVFPSTVLAVEAEGEHGWGWWETAGRWFNLLLLFGVIIYFTREPLRNYFVNRRQEIQQEIKDAQAARAQAEQKLAAIESRMKNLDEELAHLRADAESEAEMQRQRILEEAEHDAQKIVSLARREIEGMTRTAQSQLKDYAARLSVELAEGRIRSEMTPQDEQRVIARFFSKLGSGESK